MIWMGKPSLATARALLPAPCRHRSTQHVNGVFVLRHYALVAAVPVLVPVIRTLHDIAREPTPLSQCRSKVARRSSLPPCRPPTVRVRPRLLQRLLV